MRRPQRYRIPLALLLLLAAFFFCAGGFAQLLGEGPHGPEGRITWAPGTPLRTLLLIGVSILLFAWSVRLLSKRR